MAPISFIVWSFGDEAGLVSVFFKNYIACLGLIMYREQKKLEGHAITEKGFIWMLV